MKPEQIMSVLRGGGTVFLSRKSPMLESDRDRYILNPNGVNIGKRAFEKLSDDLEPVGDGMFGDSQTYRLKTEG